MSATTKWRSSSKKAKPSSDVSPWLRRLDELEALRAPYAGCAERNVARMLEHVPSMGPIIELGAGSGQLRSWLPSVVRERCVHTEPDRPALERLARRFPEANVCRARAQALPFEASSAAAVVALCLFDMLEDLETTFGEAARVLRPGGVLCHVLDMMPSLAAQLPEILRRDCVPLPNVFSDSSHAEWPQNLLLSERGPLLRLLDALRDCGHPLPRLFGHYFDRFRAPTVDAQAVAADYDVLASTPDARRTLATLLQSGFEMGWRLGLAPPQGTLFSSSAAVAARLARTAANSGFDVEVNEIYIAWDHGEARGEHRYRRLWLGQELLAQEPSSERMCKDAPAPPSGSALVEAGMAMFVARRRAAIAG
jgi:SAM-dependent methyltransferase